MSWKCYNSSEMLIWSNATAVSRLMEKKGGGGGREVTLRARVRSKICAVGGGKETTTGRMKTECSHQKSLRRETYWRTTRRRRPCAAELEAPAVDTLVLPPKNDRDSISVVGKRTILLYNHQPTGSWTWLMSPIVNSRTAARALWCLRCGCLITIR